MYKIQISRTAEKQLEKLPSHVQDKINKIILSLAHDPFPPGIKKLSGYEDIFRIRAGDYRIIYQVHARQVLVIILKIGHRKDVYR